MKSIYDASAKTMVPFCPTVKRGVTVEDGLLAKIIYPHVPNPHTPAEQAKQAEEEEEEEEEEDESTDSEAEQTNFFAQA